MAYKLPPYAEPQRKPKEDAKEGKVTAAVNMEEPESENLEELLRRVIKQSFTETASCSVEYPGKHASAGQRRGAAISHRDDLGYRGPQIQTRLVRTRVREGTTHRLPTWGVTLQWSRCYH